MSSPTPRDRQRSAARFREIADDELIERSLIKSLKEGACVPQTQTWREAFRTLADLIDPTCHADRHHISAEDTGRAHGFDMITCSRCGGVIADWRTHAAPLSPPVYCCFCGARIVRDGE